MTIAFSEEAGSWRTLFTGGDRTRRIGATSYPFSVSWQQADGLPSEIKSIFGAQCELVVGLVDHKTALPGGSRRTSTDLLAIVNRGDTTCAVAFDGHLKDVAGPTIGEWQADLASGKERRLVYLCNLLGLKTIAHDIRYQLLKRTAAALVESDRFRTDEAAVAIHAFGGNKSGFRDFSKFLALFGIVAEPDTLMSVTLPTGKRLHFAWINGSTRGLDPRYAAARPANALYGALPR